MKELVKLLAQKCNKCKKPKDDCSLCPVHRLKIDVDDMKGQIDYFVRVYTDTIKFTLRLIEESENEKQGRGNTENK